MTIFATPDFGASAGIACFLMMVWVIVFGIVTIGIVRGSLLLQKESPKTRKSGLLLIVASGLIPLSCCFLPQFFVRVAYGNFPIGQSAKNKIMKDMTKAEVIAALGSPHSRNVRDDGENWYYWCDSFGILWFCVRFGEDGRVVGTHGN